MFRSTLIGIIVGTSLAFNGLIIDSASAQNQSDNTGGNLSDNTGGNLSDNTGSNLLDNTGTRVSAGIGLFNSSGGLNPEIIQTGEQFANQLSSNRQRFSNSNRRRYSFKRCNLRRFAIGQGSGDQTTTKPKLRTFAIGQKDPSRSCPIPQEISAFSNSTELNNLLQKSKKFLSQVNQGVEATKASINNRLW